MSTDEPLDRLDGARRLATAAFGQVVYVQNWENARHLRNGRAVGANVFAMVVAVTLGLVQFIRFHQMFAVTLLGFLLFVALLKLLMSIELKFELDDCMARIARQIETTPWRDDVGLMPLAGAGHKSLRSGWLYTAIYAATVLALAVVIAHILST